MGIAGEHFTERRGRHPSMIGQHHVSPSELDECCCDSAREVLRLRAALAEIQRWTIEAQRRRPA